MTNTQLTLTQHAVLSHAIHNTGGKIVRFPEHIKGGARQKVCLLYTSDAADE